jgi:hypothetical protein
MIPLAKPGYISGGLKKKCSFKFKEFKALVEKPARKKIKVLRSDN